LKRTITLALPTGHTTGDHLFVLSAAHVPASTAPLPSGYTSIYNKSTWLQLGWKLDSGSEGSSVGVVTTGINTTCIMFGLRGGPGSQPTVATSATTNNSVTGSGTVNTPALSPSVDNGIAIAIGSAKDNFTSFTAASQYADIGHVAFSAGSHSLMCGYVIQTSRASLAADGFTVGGFGSSIGCDGSVIVLDSGVLATLLTRSLLGVGA